MGDYATYDSTIVMFDVMGFGKPLDEIPIMLEPSALGLVWGSVARQRAAGQHYFVRRTHRKARPGNGTRSHRHRVKPHSPGQRYNSTIRSAKDGQR